MIFEPLRCVESKRCIAALRRAQCLPRQIIETVKFKIRALARAYCCLRSQSRFLPCLQHQEAHSLCCRSALFATRMASTAIQLPQGDAARAQFIQRYLCVSLQPQFYEQAHAGDAALERAVESLVASNRLFSELGEPGHVYERAAQAVRRHPPVSFLQTLHSYVARAFENLSEDPSPRFLQTVNGLHRLHYSTALNHVMSEVVLQAITTEINKYASC
jgi:hypothetical protein